MDLECGSKSIQTSLILRQRHPKSYKLLNFFMISVILFKMRKHSDFHLIFFQIEGAWQHFTVVTKLIKKFKSLYGFGGCFLKVRDVCMDFEPYFKVHNLVSVRHKSIILGQMTNLNMVFHVVIVFSTLFSGFGYPDETLPLMFDILLQERQNATWRNDQTYVRNRLTIST